MRYNDVGRRRRLAPAGKTPDNRFDHPLCCRCSHGMWCQEAQGACKHADNQTTHRWRPSTRANAIRTLQNGSAVPPKRRKSSTRDPAVSVNSGERCRDSNVQNLPGQNRLTISAADLPLRIPLAPSAHPHHIPLLRGVCDCARRSAGNRPWTLGCWPAIKEQNSQCSLNPHAAAFHNGCPCEDATRRPHLQTETRSRIKLAVVEQNWSTSDDSPHRDSIKQAAVHFHRT